MCYCSGVSRWVGGKTSLSTLSMSLHCHNDQHVPRDTFEDERHLHRDEVLQPALPYRYVIGLSGLVYQGRATSLGLIVRKVQVCVVKCTLSVAVSWCIVHIMAV